jgi:hypothetical protein
MFSRQILIIVAAIGLTPALAFSADSPPPASRAESLVNICRELVDDISQFAREGDADLAALLESDQLTGDVDWTAMVKDQHKTETVLQGLCVDLLRLQDRNEDAKSIVAKFKITQQPSTTIPQ